MMPEFVRDAAAAGAVLAFFASSWFGWALDDPPRSWRSGLVAGAITSGVTALFGAWVAWLNWETGTAFDASTSQVFGIIVVVEFGLAGLGAWVLSSRGRKELIPPWIALVVGVHFFPLATLLGLPLLHVLASLVSAGAVISPVLARSRSLPTSAVTGVTTGLLLLAGAVFSLITVMLV